MYECPCTAWSPHERESRCRSSAMDEDAMAKRLTEAAGSQTWPAPHASQPPPASQPRSRPLAASLLHPLPSSSCPAAGAPRAEQMPASTWAKGRVDDVDDGAGVLTPRSKQLQADRIAHQPAAHPTATPGAAHCATPGGGSASRCGTPGGAYASLVALGAASADGLNEAQRRASTFEPRLPLVIFAPAGAGKTLTLVHRVLFLSGGGGLMPSQVLCLTFTRKAATEVRQRLQAMAAIDVEVATFHGWCLRLLRNFAHVLGRPTDFRLASPSQQLGLLREAIAAWQAQQNGGGEDGSTPMPRATPAASGLMPSGLTARRAHDATTALCRRLQRAMRDAKLLGASASAQTNALLMSDVGAFVTAHYDASLRRCGLVDLGDLQSIAVELLQRPQVREQVHERYKHLLIDEFQDTNLQQLQIIKLICQPASASAHPAEAPPAGAAASGKAERRETLEGSRVQSRTTALQPAPPQPISQQPPPLTPRAIGITVVGDDDQSIYSFRGAQPGMFFAFGRHMQGCGTVTLSQNYRSSGSIVQGATAVIQRNPQRIDKQVWTARDKGDPIEVCECRNIACEHDLVVSKLREIQNANGSLADVAVLYRTHAVGRGVYHALKENRIPCTTSSADTFARPDVQPLIAALRLITNTEDDASFRAVATSTSPTIDGALLNKVVVEAVRVGGSLHAAAKSLHAGSRMLAMDSSLATGGSIGPAQLDSAACKALHALLHKIDELRRAARTLPPSQLLANVMRSGLLTSLNPDRPPHGAKLLADELTAGMGSGEAAASSQRLSLNVGTPCSTPGAPSGRMPPPPGATDRLTALRAFLEHSAMSEHEDAGAGNGGRPVGVTLSTIHGAKGREWATVLIVRVNEETLPLSMPTDDEEGCSPEQLAEERRLLYVAMTRAKRKLVISYVATGADKVPLSASRFLKALPSEVINATNHYELSNARVGGDGGGAAFAQRASQGGGGGPAPVTPMAVPPEDKPTGALAHKLKKWQREESARKEKKAAASAKKAAKQLAAEREAASGSESQPSRGKQPKKHAVSDAPRHPPPKRTKPADSGEESSVRARRRAFIVDDDSDEDLFS